MIYTRRS